MTRTRTWFAILTLSVWAQAVGAGQEPPVFCIGTPDGETREFGLAKELWPSYLKVFPKPVEYVVGRSSATDWPYLHPSTNDRWAGGRPHTFTIRFQIEKLDERPQFLIIGAADAHPSEDSLVTVAVNGQAAPTQRAPKGPGV
ncbi:MAG: hypothetical protein FJ279_37190, partial [Planctomycetes bacterium]|nr:hypothetical protein [Planctomycetota bacterium]